MLEEDAAMISPGKHHRITMPTKFLLIITASLLFPPLGGVLQLLSLEAKHFDVLHFACLIPYLVFIQWLRMYLRNGIRISDGTIEITSWFSSSAYRMGEGTRIGEVLMPAQNHMTGRFEYMRHLYLESSETHHLMRCAYIIDYDAFKAQLEAQLQAPLLVAKVEKSALLKTVEFMELAG